jgi:hypothetical protein
MSENKVVDSSLNFDISLSDIAKKTTLSPLGDVNSVCLPLSKGATISRRKQI